MIYVYRQRISGQASVQEQDKHIAYKENPTPGIAEYSQELQINSNPNQTYNEKYTLVNMFPTLTFFTQ